MPSATDRVGLRCAGRVTHLVLWMVACVWRAAAAQEPIIPDRLQDAMDAYGETARQIKADTETKLAPYQDGHLAELTAVLSGGRTAAQSALGIRPARSGAATTAEPDGVHFILFVSSAMPPGEVRSALELASSDSRVRLVFRGLLEDHSVPTFERWIGKMGHDLTPLPVVLIDPPLFVKLHIHRVPTLVGMDGDVEWARVEGLFNPDWLQERMVAGRVQDLGDQGPTVAPREEDLMEQIKKLFAGVNEKTLREQAMAHFWSHQPELSLPRASQSRAHWVDPTIRVGRDLVDHEGHVIARAGDTVNPLALVPFRQRLIIIDAHNEADRAFAKAQAASAGTLRVVVMSVGKSQDTGDPTKVWDQWRQWESDIGQRLYLLSDALRDRFQVQAIPSVIEADAQRFKVTEHAPVENKGNKS